MRGYLMSRHRVSSSVKLLQGTLFLSFAAMMMPMSTTAPLDCKQAVFHTPRCIQQSSKYHRRRHQIACAASSDRLTMLPGPISSLPCMIPAVLTKCCAAGRM